MSLPDVAAWVRELDRLERAVDDLELALPRDELVDVLVWRRPEHLGQMPPAFRLRAQELHERQEACLAELRQRVGAAARQHAVTVAVSRATLRDGVPVYVDEAI